MFLSIPRSFTKFTFYRQLRNYRHVAPKEEEPLTIAQKSIAQKIDLGMGRGKRPVLGKRDTDNSRINILSHELCKDVIDRLAPSLEKYKGCDLIDVNPGTCIWSSALHNHLKPRTHLLLERDAAVYEQFYQPLLENEGSTYKLIQASGLLWETWKSISEHLPNQELLTPGDPRQDLPNHTLLFTANLGRSYRPQDRYQLAHLFMHQLMSATRNHTIFQKYGQIRMLIWVEDVERYGLLPRVISNRGKFTVEAELSYESIVEVASAAELKDKRRRETSLEVDRTMQVVQNMKSAGIETPSGRAKLLESEALQKLGEVSGKKKAKSTKKVLALNKRWLKELQDLEARFEAGELPQWMSQDPEMIDNENNLHPEYERMLGLQYRYSTETKRFVDLDHRLSQYMSILAQEKAVQNLPAAEAEEKKEEIKKLREELRTSLDTKPLHFRDQFWLRVHDRLAYSTDPPLLYWDRRPYEPLKVNPEEFHPKEELALYDLKPRTLEPVYRSMENYDDFNYIMIAFWQVPTQSVATALESLAPGALEWLLPLCPSLTDVSKGGSPDLEDLIVRRITQEHIREIMEAWVDWPFKPTFEEIMQRSGTPLVHDELEEPMEFTGAPLPNNL